MPRPRSPENKSLPTRWRLQHGAYYYQVPIGKEAAWGGKRMFRLGKTLSEAHMAFAERVGVPQTVHTIGGLLDRYMLEVVPTKAPKTRTGNIAALPRLRAVFGEMRLRDIRPQHVYMYASKRSVKVPSEKGRATGGLTAAHREIEVLSHVFTKAVEWGLIDRHPFKGEVRLAGEPPRTRYVDDWEVVEALAMEPHARKGAVRWMPAYIKLKLLTGMSKGDLLRLEPARQFKDDGIHIQRHKTAGTTGQRTIYEWTPERRAAVEEALATRPVDISPFLFCNRFGHGYVDEERGTTSGFDTVWQDFMARLLRETKVVERFTEHDLRAKCASDAPSLEKARALLSHADMRTTQRVYRRKPERV